MAGRFPLYTDADIRGPVVRALKSAGWDVLRAIDAYPEKTLDPVHFGHAAREGRVMVANDADMKALAESWLAVGKPFRGLVWWPRRHYDRMSEGDFVAAFEALAIRDDPFSPYPVLFLKPSS